MSRFIPQPLQSVSHFCKCGIIQGHIKNVNQLFQYFIRCKMWLNNIWSGGSDSNDEAVFLVHLCFIMIFDTFPVKHCVICYVNTSLRMWLRWRRSTGAPGHACWGRLSKASGLWSMRWRRWPPPALATTGRCWQQEMIWDTSSSSDTPWRWDHHAPVFVCCGLKISGLRSMQILR